MVILLIFNVTINLPFIKKYYIQELKLCCFKGDFNVQNPLECLELTSYKVSLMLHQIK